MTPEDILAQKPRVLTQATRERYFETGFLAAEGLIPPGWLDRLIALSDAVYRGQPRRCRLERGL